MQQIRKSFHNLYITNVNTEDLVGYFVALGFSVYGELEIMTR